MLKNNGMSCTKKYLCCVNVCGFAVYFENYIKRIDIFKLNFVLMDLIGTAQNTEKYCPSES
jgi:hypothetical protein